MSAELLRTNKTWIQTTPDVCGGDPCIRDTRITVHGIVEYKQLGLSDGAILERIRGLTREDLDAAIAYYREHRQEIDDIIRAEAEA